MGDIMLIHEGMPDLLPMMGRSPGMHVSDIIYNIAVRLGYLKGPADDSGDDEAFVPNAHMGLGSALEHAIIHRFALDEPGRYLQIGELERDGLFGTPDLVDLEDWILIEIKLTWMSSRHDPDSQKFWRYWVQVMAYCIMLETNVARLHVCHVMGDYKGSGPIYRIWERRFSNQELAENWRMLVSHGRAMARDRQDDGTEEERMAMGADRDMERD